MDRIVSGVQPTNKLHIGNYFGAIQQMVNLQNNYESFIFVADLHALTTLPNNTKALEPIGKFSDYVLAAYLACGINTNETKIFLQSNIVQHPYFSWILSCITPLGYLDRMAQMKDKSKNLGRWLGIYAYPVLMSSDILLYNPKYVPVGEDQKQHLELTRYLAESLNKIMKEDYFNIPEIFNVSSFNKIKSLKNPMAKMSKSAHDINECIFLDDDGETIARKIKKATTDTLLMPAIWEENLFLERPGVMNLINIYGACTGESIGSVIEVFAHGQISYFKKQLTDVLISKFVPMGEKINYFLENIQEIRNEINKNNDYVYAIAQKNLEKVKDILL